MVAVRELKINWKEASWQNGWFFYHLQKDSGKSGWKVNGTWLFWSFQRKISRSNGTSVKVVLFFRTGYSKQNFVFNFFKVIFDTGFRPSRSFSGKWKRPFPSSKKFRFQNEAKCETFVVKMSFICIIIKDHFFSLALKVWFFGTRKWHIDSYKW